MKRGDYEGAYRLFERSYAFDPTPGAALNLADCEEHLGKLADALDHFNAAAQSLASSDDRRPVVAGRIGRLEPRVPSISIPSIASASDETVVLDNAIVFYPANTTYLSGPFAGKQRHAFDAPFRVNPGPHSLRWVVAFRGVTPIDVTHSISVAESENAFVVLPSEVQDGAAAHDASQQADQELEFRRQERVESFRAEVEARQAAHAQAPTPEQVQTPQERREKSREAWETRMADASRPGRTWGAIGMGVGFGIPGAIGLILGSVWGANVLSDKSTVNQHCRGNQCDQTGLDAASDGQSASVASPIALAAGTAFSAIAVFGVYAFLKTPSYPTTSVAIRPVPGGATMALTQDF